VFPGGHLEYGESLSQCALRELEEESNLQGKFERLVFISESIAPDNSRHIINFFALVSVDEKQEMQVGNDEDVLVELAYVPIARIKELTLYPNIADRLQREHESGWQHPGIQLVHTPWL
jgi:ADP-ribose pyrophosphatase YjhB (NUDIX family)